MSTDRVSPAVAMAGHTLVLTTSGVVGMKTLACFILTLGLAALVASPSFAQRQPGQGRGGFGAGQGGVANLIRNEAVQKELKMDKEQTDKATEAVKKVTDKHADEFTKLRDLAQEERRTKTTELTKIVSDETLVALGEVLKPEQLKRLKQIELQRAGVAAFTRPDVEKALVFNDEQKGKVKAIADESATKMRELMGAGGQGGARGARGAGGAGGARGGAAPDQAKITALRKEMSEKVMLVLNDDQKKTWKDLTGDAFEVPARVAPKKDD
jgi:hypothetical protein